MSIKKKKFVFKEHRITVFRRIVQVTAFLIINYVILEFILFNSVNLALLEGMTKALPILNTPRNPLSEGAGFLEYILYFIAEGEFPFFLIAILMLIFLFSNRMFCGWICPIGAIQDGLYAIPTKTKKNPKQETHSYLVKVKFIILIILLFMIIPLGSAKLTDIEFYFEYKENLGAIAQKPVSFFSLSEFIFVFIPNLFEDIWADGMMTLAPLNPFAPDNNLFNLLFFIVYLVILITAVWYPRVYCRYFCPFGACAAAVSEFSFLKLSRSPVKCVGKSECGICERVCPKQIRILDEPFEFFTGKGECNFCLKCKEACPHDAIGIKFG